MSFLDRIAAARTAFAAHSDMVPAHLVTRVLDGVESGARQAEHRMTDPASPNRHTDAARAAVLREVSYDIRATFGWPQPPAVGVNPTHATTAARPGDNRVAPVATAQAATGTIGAAGTAAATFLPLGLISPTLGDINGRIAEARANLLNLEEAREEAFRQLAAQGATFG